MLKLIVRKIAVITISKNYGTKQFVDLINVKPRTRLEILRRMAPKHRENPIITKLDTAEFKSIFSDELKTLVSIFEKHGHEIRVCGGAVRDLLMGLKPKDLDFATTATPDEMKNMFTEENVRMINMKGEKHGTITPRINDKENFEVTTLRIDVVTDGRHAEVQYTTDWLLDANRRDLTINSMFLGLDGSVYDYFYGYEDIKKRRIAFVGEATTRIQEDYLRILRYFRFYGRIAETPDAHEEITLEAIRENVTGLQGISGERIWTELKKILEGNFAGEIMQTIIECGLSPYIGLPPNPNTEELKLVWKRSQKHKLHAITLLVSLLKTEEHVIQLNLRLKLSMYERELAFFLVEHRAPKLSSNPLLPYQILLLKSKSKQSNTREWIIEVLKYNNSPVLQEFVDWEIPKFPVNGAVLKEKGIQGGKFMGSVLNELRNHWADHNFNLSEEDLLKEVPKIVECLQNKKIKNLHSYALRNRSTMNDHLVTIEEGQLKGKYVVGWKGYSFYSFQGIPYAQPPLGVLRFKAPKPIDKWSGIRDCTREGSECYSRHLFNMNLIGSEDCLILNVYTKQLSKQKSDPKPVMVWIHGGAFISGSSNTDFHGPDYLVHKDVVLVTINYRLGYLGFFSLEDPDLEVPGNCGFKDQVMALKWVQRNIKHFGGDPNNVTIFGVSAGAASVHSLILSPMAKGLFHKAIIQSASLLCPWAVTKSPSKNVMAKTGCSTEKELLKYLQELPVEKLYELQENMGDHFNASRVRELGLVIEKPTKTEPNFMTDYPLNIIKSGNYNKVPIIIGYCDREGFFYGSIEKKKNISILIKDFEDAIPNTLGVLRGSEKSKEIAQKIKHFYYKDEEPSEENKEKFYLLATDLFFQHGINKAMRYHALESNPPVYFYKFSLETRLNIYKKFTGIKYLGTAHADDIAYLFTTDFTPKDIEENSAEDTAIEKVTKIWTNFAKTGNPNPVLEKDVWNPVRGNLRHFLHITEKFSVGINADGERMKFWDDIEIS